MLRTVRALAAACLAALPLPSLAVSDSDIQFIQQEIEGVYSRPNTYSHGQVISQALFRVMYSPAGLVMARGRTPVDVELQSVDRQNRSINLVDSEGGLATFQRMGGMAVLTMANGKAEHMTFVRHPAEADQVVLAESYLIGIGHAPEDARRIVAGEMDPAAPRAQGDTGQNAGFDCDQSGTDVERMICGDQRLADLDRRLGDVYAKVIDYGNDEDRAYFRDDQRQWLAQRDQCAGSGCLASKYAERIDILEQALQYMSKPAEFQ